MSDIEVRKANTILTIPEEQKDEYLSKGYDILGADGRVVEKATPQDVPTLQAKLADALMEIEVLKKQVEAFQAKPIKKTVTRSKKS